MFWSKNKKNGMPLHSPVLLFIQLGVQFSWACFLDVCDVEWFELHWNLSCLIMLLQNGTSRQ